MSDLSYWLIRATGRPVIWLTSRQTVLHVERARQPGPYILASSHLSPYDVPGLIAVTPRYLDFLSITEMLKNPFVARLFKAMNCSFVDRHRADSAAAHSLAGRLRRGRVVAMFPEGGIRAESASVINGGSFKPGVIRLAQLANVPILPCVILGTIGYAKPTSWIPHRSVRFGVNYGQPIHLAGEDQAQARVAATEQLRQAYLALAGELRDAMEKRKASGPPGHR